MMLSRKRTSPYTERGIARVPCVKCGQPSRFQWRICATGSWHAVCRDHDVDINRQIAMWAFGAKDGAAIADAYEKSLA